MEGSRSSSASRINLSNIGSNRKSARATLTIVNRRAKPKKPAVDLEAINKSHVQQIPPNFLVRNVPLLLEENSLYLFGSKNWFRQKVLEFILHPYFEVFILFVILANAILLGIVDYRYVDSDNNLSDRSIRNAIEHKSSIVFIAIFIFEMVLKVIAYGLFSAHEGYLRDSWHWLDLIVIVTGIIVEVSPSSPTLNIIRLFRLLRPLRTIEKLPTLKRIVVCILESFPQLGGVVFLLSFIFLIYAIFGLQVFLGPQLHTACRSTPTLLTSAMLLTQAWIMPNTNVLTCLILIGHRTSQFIRKKSPLGLRRSLTVIGLLRQMILLCKILTPGVSVHSIM